MSVLHCDAPNQLHMNVPGAHAAAHSPLCGDDSAPQHDTRLCLKTRSGFERLIFRLTASGSIDDKTNIPPLADFAVFARRKTARSRADDGVFRKSLP
jgi:hypothetical protein